MVGCVGQVVGMVLGGFVGHRLGMVDKGCFVWWTAIGWVDKSVGHTVGMVR